MLRPNLTSLFDLLVGFLLLYTSSPVPEQFATVHASVLIFKGILFQFRLPNISMITPLLIVFGGIDIISAAILFVGEPPVLGEYKVFLSAFLALKGLISFLNGLK